MQLTGQHRLPAKPEQLWALLMDADFLAKVTPGISRLERLEDDKYKAIAEVKIGPVKGTFSGELIVAEKQEPGYFLLKVTQNSAIGNVAADVAIHLHPVAGEEATDLAFDGKAQMSGLLARTGQRVMTGVANALTKQFFEALEKELAL